MVEVLKGPDKGKLGIIKMIVQVGKLRPICSLLSCSHAKTWNLQERNWVTVEGLNLKYETIAQSGMIETPTIHGKLGRPAKHISTKQMTSLVRVLPVRCPC